jgi:hypothetical protein
MNRFSQRKYASAHPPDRVKKIIDKSLERKNEALVLKKGEIHLEVHNAIHTT